MEGLRLSSSRATDCGQRLACNVADTAEMQARDVVEATHIMEEVTIGCSVRVDEGNRFCRWPNCSHGTVLLVTAAKWVILFYTDSDRSRISTTLSLSLTAVAQRAQRCQTIRLDSAFSASLR